jgi:hypothetical protein
LSETAGRESPSMSASWLALLVVFLFFEIAFLVGAYTSGVAGPERVFAIFTGLAVVVFGAILYAGRLVFYE